MTARRAKRTSTSKGPGTALRTTPGGRASATPKTQCRLPTPQRAVATPPHGQAIGLRQRLKWLTKTPRPARAGDSPSTSKGPGTALRTTPGGRASATPKTQCRLPTPQRAVATPPHGQRRSADKNFSRTRFATLAHTPRRPQAAGATPSRRASMRRGSGSAFSKSRPPEASTHGSGRVSSDRQRPGLSRHAGGGSTSHKQFPGIFP